MSTDAATPMIDPPSWFKQRQAKAEPAGADTLKLTAPNMKEAFISIRKADNGLYSASLRTAPEGPDLATSEAAFADAEDAWEEAFELYRTRLIV